MMKKSTKEKTSLDMSKLPFQHFSRLSLIKCRITKTFGINLLNVYFDDNL